MKVMRQFLYSIGEDVNGLKIIDKIEIPTKWGGTEKGYLVQSIAYPDAPLYEVKEGNLRNGKGDAYVTGRRVYEGNSLYSCVEFRKFIKDDNEGKKVSRNSPKFLEFVCPECGMIKSMRVYHLVNYGFSCPTCSSGTSYPELFMMAYFKIKNIPFEYQVKLNNSSRRFDFKIELNNTSYIIETHGKQHYDKSMKWYGDTIKSDKIKRQYCKQNNIILIEIDCRESDFDFIEKSIRSIDFLPAIKEEERKSIISSINSNKKYPTKKIIDANNSGLRVKEISKLFNLTPRVVHLVLKRSGTKINGSKKKTHCITTGITYESTQEASKKTGVSQSSISNCCNGKRKTAGKLRWKYIY